MKKQDSVATQKPWSAIAGVIISIALMAGLATTQDAAAGGGKKYCTATARDAFKACKNEVADDYWIAKAICNNVSDDADRAECETEARESKKEDRKFCGEQRGARMELCNLVGEDRYDPDFDPANFIDPDEIGDSVAPNMYFPLVPGTKWVYEGGDEVITVVVTDKTKLIEGVTCRVVNDVVEDGGEVIEDTDDWYAQHVNGDVWYCGELARDFETFEGDDPDDPELVEIEGSFKAGRDGDKPGILMLAAPQVGDVYRQESSLGNAEDAAEVISLTGTETVPAAECNNGCLITREFTPIEPGIEAEKYYAPGIGTILEVEGGERVELVEVIFP